MIKSLFVEICRPLNTYCDVEEIMIKSLLIDDGWIDELLQTMDETGVEISEAQVVGLSDEQGDQIETPNFFKANALKKGKLHLQEGTANEKPIPFCKPAAFKGRPRFLLSTEAMPCEGEWCESCKTNARAPP